VQLDKLDKYLCLKKSDVVIPVEGEDDSSSDEDDEDGSGDEDGEDGESSGDDTLATPKQVLVEAKVDVEEKEEDVSNSIECQSQGLICGIGSTC
jgi:hypothetical protein